MRETIFKTSNLSKKYHSTYALNGVDMEIKRGDIYGFVGENGAGKTTLFRILGGLSYQTDGKIFLFGKNTDRELTKQRERIGCMVETPALYPGMTARENIDIHRMVCGIPDRSCVEKVLEMVNLTDTGRKKVKNFSLGMKQRLGIAIALLNEPEFLILDEPVNGLDPMGIVELRELLKTLNKEREITMLISSHILGELYQLATCYGFIHKGKMVEQLSLAELDEKCKRHILIQVDDAPKAAIILETKLMTTKFEVLPQHIIKLYDFLDDPARVSRELSVGGVITSELSTRGDDLESYYMQIIGGKKNG